MGKLLILASAVCLCIFRFCGAIAVHDMFGQEISSMTSAIGYVAGGGAVLTGASYMWGAKAYAPVWLGVLGSVCAGGTILGLQEAQKHSYSPWIAHVAVPCLGALMCGGNKLCEAVQQKLKFSSMRVTVPLFAACGACAGAVPGLCASLALYVVLKGQDVLACGVAT